MLKVEPETGDLKELSDDEFLHLLQEASTFNKPNNQESILLKQLRKEVAESDSCENASRSETDCVSKRPERKCSNINSAESRITHCTVTATSNSAPFPSTSFKLAPRKTEEVPVSGNSMVLNISDAAYSTRPQVPHHVIEIEPSNENWTLKAKKSYSAHSETSDSVSKHSNKLSESDKRDDTHSLSSNSYIYDLNAFAADQANSSSSDVKARSKQETATTRAGEESSSRAAQSTKKAVSALVFGSSDFLSNDIQMPDNSEHRSSPLKGIQDIELTEFSRSNAIDNKAEAAKKRDASPVKDQGCAQLGSSKFYVNCSEVDSPVTLPLKFVSNLDERNGSSGICDPLSDQAKRQINSYSSCFPWPHTTAAPTPQILFSPGPVDHDSLKSQNDSDCGNPFSSRGSRTPNLTSIVSATLLDYPNSTLSSDNSTSKLDWSHRKHKRTRNHADNTILSENIAGHRGNEDIDSLVKFIEAADKNDKTLSRNNPNHIISKNNSTPDNFKRKINGKESKSNQNKPFNLCKKKSQANMEENSSGTTDDSKTDFNKNISSESELSDDSYVNKNNNNKMSSPEFNTSSLPLDINSNVMEEPVSDSSQTSVSKENSGHISGEELDNSSVCHVDPTSPEISSFASDFYYMTDAVAQAVEESGFRIVKKKQRKKHQGKRSENYRWHSAAARAGQNASGNHTYYSKEQAEHGSGMMLLPGMALSQRGQCGNQDSRRKSTSSVPHSEQSSADNSDLDSVHSLPVRGSAPHPTKAHPHTTPSSTSSTPQASYADIARMPVSATSKLSPSVASNVTPVVPAKYHTVSEGNQCNLDTPYSTGVERNLFTSPPALENDTASECIVRSVDSTTCKSTREINTQTEPLVSSESVASGGSNTNIPVREPEKTPVIGNRKTACAASACKGKVCVCTKEEKPHPPVSLSVTLSKANPNERTQRPAVVMMGSIPTTEASDISFGIDLKEILQISSDEHLLEDPMRSSPCAVEFVTPLPDNNRPSDESKTRGSAVSESVGDDTCVEVDLPKSSLNSDGGKMCDADQASTFHDNPSSPCNELFLPSGQKLQFKECNDVDTELFNYKQIVELIAKEWKNVHKEYCSEFNKHGDKVKYYENSC